MLLSYFTFKQKVPELNEIEFGEREIFFLLRRDKVHYIETPLTENVLGMYVTTEDKQEFILIKDSLTGTEKVRTQAHETVHHFLDQPIDGEIVRLFRTLEVLNFRADITAEALSLIMIFPLPLLNKFLDTGELPTHLQPYLTERLELFYLHEI